MLLASLERWRAVRSPGPTLPPQPASHLLWFCDAMLLFFALPWLTDRVLGVDPDLYIAVELALTLVFVAAYVVVAGPSLPSTGPMLAVSLGLAVPCIAVLVALVITGVDATARPTGAALVASLLWRGLVDGVVTSLLLGVFPVVVARELARTAPPRVEPWMRWILSFVLVGALSAAHHLGFEQFDDRSLAPVEVTSTVASLPMIVSGNPAGSVVTQVVLHTAVILEGYETDALLPPQRLVVRSYRPPGLFPPPEADRNRDGSS